LEQQLDGLIAAFVNLIERKYLSTQTKFVPMDLAEKCHYFTLDAISSIAFGPEKIFGFLEKDKDVHHFIEMTVASMPVMTGLATYPAIAKVLQSPLFRSLMPSEKDRYGLGQFIRCVDTSPPQETNHETKTDTNRVARQVVAERFGPDAPVRKDMVNSFLAHGLTREELESEILTTIIGGSDTTASVLTCTLLYLITSPSCYSILKGEIKDGIGQGRISSPITEHEARELPYLQAVIKEGLRINPPIAHLQTMKVPAGGDTVLGKFLPGGTNISNALVSNFQSDQSRVCFRRHIA
jgi:cytochrome P450